MRAFIKAALAIGLFAGLTAPAQAQGPGGRGMGGGSLLSNKAVQKELKLSDEQIEKADKAAAEIREKMMEKFSELRELEGEERQEKMATLQKELAADSKKVSDEILKPEQAKRLEQITLQFGLQQGGAQYLSSNPDLAAKLKITDEQKNKLKDLVDDSRAKQQELRDSAQGGDPAEMRQKFLAFQKESQEKVTALLTDEQKAAWKELTGEPFTIVMEQRRRPGGAQ